MLATITTARAMTYSLLVYTVRDVFLALATIHSLDKFRLKIIIRLANCSACSRSYCDCSGPGVAPFPVAGIVPLAPIVLLCPLPEWTSNDAISSQPRYYALWYYNAVHKCDIVHWCYYCAEQQGIVHPSCACALGLLCNVLHIALLTQ